MSGRPSPSTVPIDLGVGLLLLYALGTSVWEATLNPLWYDEIFTVILGQLPSMSGVIEALGHATDTSGPVYFLLVRTSAALVSDPELAFRLPSVIASTIACVAVYAFARRDLGAVAGAVAVLSMLLSRLHHGYSVEARAYAVMVMFICVAAVAWQRAASWRWTLVLGTTLALAVGTHYYAVFAGFAFIVAEIAYSLRSKRLRIDVWLALSMGGVALAWVWPLLSSLREYYGGAYFSMPTIGKVMQAYDWALFVELPGAGFGLALGLGLAMLLLCVRLWPHDEDQSVHRPAPETLVLVMMLLATPLTTFVATTVMQGGYADHYSLGMLAGIGLAVAYAVRALDSRKQAIVAMGLSCVLGMHDLVFWATSGKFNGRREQSRLTMQQQVLEEARGIGLPVVIEGGHDFLPLDYYRAGGEPKLIYVADPEAARRYVGIDSLDLDLIALNRYYPMNILDFETFRSEHKEFLLFSNSGALSWWPTRLLAEQYRLGLVSRTPQHTLYRVQHTPATPARTVLQ